MANLLHRNKITIIYGEIKISFTNCKTGLFVLTDGVLMRLGAQIMQGRIQGLILKV
jgi:hypothetical protein